MGHANSIVVLTNTSSRTCTVQGYAGFQLLGANGAALPTNVVRGSTFFQPDPGPRPISLPPGQSAWADLATTNVAASGENPAQCEPPAARLEVTPPDETTQLVAPFTGVACDHGRMDTTAFSQGSGPAA
jgi:hypothetical protein